MKKAMIALSIFLLATPIANASYDDYDMSDDSGNGTYIEESTSTESPPASPSVYVPQITYTDIKDLSREEYLSVLGAFQGTSSTTISESVNYTCTDCGTAKYVCTTKTSSPTINEPFTVYCSGTGTPSTVTFSDMPRKGGMNSQSKSVKTCMSKDGNNYYCHTGTLTLNYNVFEGGTMMSQDIYGEISGDDTGSFNTSDSAVGNTAYEISNDGTTTGDGGLLADSVALYEKYTGAIAEASANNPIESVANSISDAVSSSITDITNYFNGVPEWTEGTGLSAGTRGLAEDLLGENAGDSRAILENVLANGGYIDDQGHIVDSSGFIYGLAEELGLVAIPEDSEAMESILAEGGEVDELGRVLDNEGNIVGFQTRELDDNLMDSMFLGKKTLLNKTYDILSDILGGETDGILELVSGKDKDVMDMLKDLLGLPSMDGIHAATMTMKEMYDFIEPYLIEKYSEEGIQQGINYDGGSAFSEPNKSWDFNRITELRKKQVL